jgi:hypothetical protein
VARTMGSRWGEPARSQALLRASIALMAARRRVPSVAGPPMGDCEGVRPAALGRRDRDGLCLFRVASGRPAPRLDRPEAAPGDRGGAVMWSLHPRRCGSRPATPPGLWFATATTRGRSTSHLSAAPSLACQQAACNKWRTPVAQLCRQSQLILRPAPACQRRQRRQRRRHKRRRWCR